MTLTVSNWYIVENRLHWWMKDEKNPSPSVPSTRGKDYSGKPGMFTGYSAPIASWQSYSDGMWMITDDKGKRYIASFKTHYNNPQFPSQCAASENVITDQLLAIPHTLW